jgi:glyoxylase-like metal-dependent hydrolase (beta-lactamase superfamily II)
MTHEIHFDRSHPGHYGCPVELSPLVRRIVANNPGPFTFTGTVSHIVGRGRVAVIDPGPDDSDHLSAILSATTGETITHIIVTHTHRDHIDGLEALQQHTGAQMVGSAPNPGQQSGAPLYRPDRVLKDGDIVKDEGWSLEAVATPGHTSNHIAYALADEGAMFSGDHVMAWSTTIVAPPEGSMHDYVRSLQKLLKRPERTYYPGHGPSLRDALPYVESLLQHRRHREVQILSAVAQQSLAAADIVQAVYTSLDPALVGAARLSVLAHLEDLAERGAILREDQLGKPPRFRLA